MTDDITITIPIEQAVQDHVTASCEMYMAISVALEETGLVPKGTIGKMLTGIADKCEAETDHPAGDQRLDTAILRHTAKRINAGYQDPHVWRPEIIDGGKDDAPE